MSTGKPYFSVIVPVYNRVQEVSDLLASLEAQTHRDFEVVLVDDGSTDPCGDIAQEYAGRGLDVKYFHKANEGRSIARNYGIDRSSGEWLIFFDSDCVIPPEYFAKVRHEIEQRPGVQCYGGPDAANKTFTPIQRAINYAMTSFLTTGGIRGGRRRVSRFVPRTFNMGFTREVYEKVGGFREMFSEDIDMSTRISRAGYATELFVDAPVWHKRRIDLKRFFRQVHVFGMSRITLQLLYPGSLKVVHALPAIAVVLGLVCVALAVFVSAWWLLLIAIYLLAIFAGALWQTHSLKIASLAVPAAIVQIIGYGTGFMRAYVWKILLRHGRNIQQEIEMRRGK